MFANHKKGYHYEITSVLVIGGIVFGLVSTWLANVSTQYCLQLIESIYAHQTIQYTTFLAQSFSRPLLGVSLGVWPLTASFAALVFVVAQIIKIAKVDDLMIARDEQYGSERLATPDELKAYGHTSVKTKVAGKTVSWPKPSYCETLEDDNMLLGERLKVSLSPNPNERYKPANNHVFVVAGSGAGKTFRYVTSNVLQCNASYVFTDPKGELFARFAKFLEAHGYEVRLVDLRPNEAGIRASHAWNPMHYCDSPTMIDDFAERLIASTTTSEATSSSNTDYFTNMEKLAYGALLKMELYWFRANGREEDYNIPSLVEWLNKLKGSNDAGKSVLDLVFFATEKEHGFCGYEEYLRRRFLDSRCHGSEQLLQQLPEWEAINNYIGFTSMADSPETRASVMSSCYNRLRAFMNSAVRTMLTRPDELDLDQLGQRKQALFILTADSGGPYDFLAAMLTSQIFAINARIGDDSPGHHLPIPVICYLDEIANIGRLPNLDKLFATLRSRWINLVAITQYTDQLKTAYKEGARSIQANASIYLYLGAGDWKSCEDISKMIGDHTVHYMDRSITRTQTGSSVTESIKAVKQPIYSASELFNAGGDKDKILVHIAGERWVEDKKPDPRTHPRWHEIGGEAELTDFVAWSNQWHQKREFEQLKRPTTITTDPEGRKVYDINPNDSNTYIFSV